MVLSFAVNQGAPIETGSGVPLESRGVVDHGCELNSGSYTSATGNMMGGSRKSRRHNRRSEKSSSRKSNKDRKERKSKRHQKRTEKSRQRRQRRHLNRTLKHRSSHRLDYEQQGGGASYAQLLEATPAYGDAVGSQGAMRAEVGLAKTD